MNLKHSCRRASRSSPTSGRPWRCAAPCDRLLRRHPHLAEHRPNRADRALRRLRTRLGAHDDRRSVQRSVCARAASVARLRRPDRSRRRRCRLHLARPLGAGAALRHRRVGDHPRHLRDRPRVRPPAQQRTVAAARGERLLSVAFGVIMFAHPGAGAVALLALIAAFALVTGVMQIAFALELRRAGHELEDRVRPHATPTPVTQG